MADFSSTITLIQKYEGFNEKAYPDPYSGKEPYTIGYGTGFYPDGTPVKRGQLCTKEKALEYLFNEINVIDTELSKLNLSLDTYMTQALISFIHSIGWESFLYSEIIDSIENENFSGVCEDIGRWIFDEEYNVIGGLLDRRNEEIKLFLTEIHTNHWNTSKILVNAFNNFKGTPGQLRAINELEENLNPYILSEFANQYRMDTSIFEHYIDYDSFNPSISAKS